MDLRLHHIGFLVKDIDSAAKDFVSRLGYVVESDVIEDPVQTARVQFLRQPGAGTWLELVTPNGPGSKLALALDKGGGLHHLCYETGNMESECARLRSSGMWMIAAPTPAVAFGGRHVAWFMGRGNFLLELLEAGTRPFSLCSVGALSWG